jgi:MSHA biogenesis protein MshP
MKAWRAFAQQGSALLPALFLIIVVASLAAFAIRMGATQRQTVDFALLGDRAYAAANSGVEWAVYNALHAQPCTGTLVLNQGALRGFQVQIITCQVAAHTDGVVPFRVVDVNALAQWSRFGSPDYVSRQVTRRVVTSP